MDNHGSHIGRGCYNCKLRGKPLHSENLVYECSLPQHIGKQMFWCSLWQLNNSDDIHSSPSAYTAEDAADARKDIIQILYDNYEGSLDIDEEEFKQEVGFAVDHAMAIALDIGKHIPKEEVMDEAKKLQEIPQAKGQDNIVDNMAVKEPESQEALTFQNNNLKFTIERLEAALKETQDQLADKSSNLGISVDTMYHFKKKFEDEVAITIEKDHKIEELEERLRSQKNHDDFVLKTVIEAAAIDKDLKAQKRGLELTVSTLLCQLVRANKNIARWEAGLATIDPEVEEDEEEHGSMGTDSGDNADSEEVGPDKEM